MKQHNRRVSETNLYPVCNKKILCHALCENLKEEPDVFEKLADNELVGLIRPQSRHQILSQFFMNSLLLRTSHGLRHKNILWKKTTEQFIYSWEYIYSFQIKNPQNVWLQKVVKANTIYHTLTYDWRILVLSTALTSCTMCTSALRWKTNTTA